MDYPKNIKEVFAPLGARLYLFESKRYLYDFDIWDPVLPMQDIMEESLDDMLMYQIGTQVNAFDPEGVLNEIAHYEGRVVKLLNQLEPRTHYYRKVPNKERVKVEISYEEQQDQLQSWKVELMLYEYELQELRQVRTEREADNQIPEHKVDVVHPNEKYQITGKPGVKEFRGSFVQQMTLPQTAIFLNYLVQNKVMPPYGVTDLAHLSKFFFARSYKIREHLDITSIEDAKNEVENLQVVHSVFQRILEAVTRDLPSKD